MADCPIRRSCAIEPWLVFVAEGASRLMVELILHHLDNAAHTPERVQYLSTVYREAQKRMTQFREPE